MSHAGCLKAFLFAAIMFTLDTTSVRASSIPEQLDYDLTWNGLKIGTSALHTAMNGQDLDIVSTVHSVAWSDPFYKVDDIETSKLRKVRKNFALQSYKMKLLEGKSNWHRAVSVDRKENAFRFVNLGTFEKSRQKLVEPAWDPLSCLYYIRQQPLTVGKSLTVNVVDKVKVNSIRVDVLRKETVVTPAGTFRTVVIQPNMSISSEGLFYAQGPTTIWLTDDDKRVPVVIRKRILNLFKNGVPSYLQGVMSIPSPSDLERVETVRAVLTGGRW